MFLLTDKTIIRLVPPPSTNLTRYHVFWILCILKCFKNEAVNIHILKIFTWIQCISSLQMHILSSVINIPFINVFPKFHAFIKLFITMWKEFIQQWFTGYFTMRQPFCNLAILRCYGNIILMEEETDEGWFVDQKIMSWICTYFLG